jgi:hypothetical protein
MRLYPDIPAARTRAILRDAAVLLVLLVLGWLALRVHDRVDELGSLGRGVRDAGTAVRGGFDTTADAVDGVPVVGGPLGEGLRDAGRGSGGEVEEVGRRGEQSAHRLANLLGVLVFAIPAAALLGRYFPARMGQARRLTAAASVLGGPEDPERRRLVAMRAAFGLPFGVLLRHTADPLGDLAASRYDGLVAAALEDAGLRPEPAPPARRANSPES